MIVLGSLSAYPGVALISTHIWSSLRYAVKTIGTDLPALKENKDVRERIEPNFGILETRDSIDNNRSSEETKAIAVKESKARARLLSDGTFIYTPAISSINTSTKSVKSIEDKR